MQRRAAATTCRRPRRRARTRAPRRRDARCRRPRRRSRRWCSAACGSWPGGAMDDVPSRAHGEGLVASAACASGPPRAPRGRRPRASGRAQACRLGLRVSGRGVGLGTGAGAGDGRAPALGWEPGQAWEQVRAWGRGCGDGPGEGAGRGVDASGGAAGAAGAGAGCDRAELMSATSDAGAASMGAGGGPGGEARPADRREAQTARCGSRSAFGLARRSSAGPPLGWPRGRSPSGRPWRRPHR